MPRIDPRLRTDPETANDMLLDRTIRHLVFALRVQNQEARDALAFLDTQVYPDLLQQIETRLARITERGFDPGPVTTKRLQALGQAMQRILTEGYGRLLTKEQQVWGDFATHEVRWQAAVIQEATQGILIETVLPSPAQIRAAVQIPLEGFPLRTWFEELAPTAQRKISQQIGIGMVQGETNEQIMRRIRGTRANRFTDGVLQTSRNAAETLVRTATIHTSTQARRIMLEENADIVKGEMWVSTLDARTCIRCQALDGQRWKTGILHPWPALHARCRCSITPWLKSWKELGIDLPEAPPGTRASMNGQVPDSLTYPAWLKRQSAAFQDEQLGKARGQLFRNGGVTITQFVNNAHDVLPLADLIKKERAAFAQVGITLNPATGRVIKKKGA